MELDLQSHHWERRHPDWAAAAIAGLAAGAVLMVLELFWALLLAGTSPWSTARLIAAIVLGRDALGPGTAFSLMIVGTALAVHYVLGLLYGVVLGSVMAPFHLDSSAAMALLAGLLFGLLLYAVNFYGMVRFFPWFAELRGPVAAGGHLLFGLCTALLYWKLERRAG